MAVLGLHFRSRAEHTRGHRKDSKMVSSHMWGEFLKRGEKGEEKKELEIFQEGRTHNQFQISSSLFGTKFSLGLVFLGLVHERHYPVGPSRHDARMNN